RSSLLHGMVLGVPVAGPVSADGRPARDATGVALGLHLDDVAGAFAADELASTADDRRVLERTLSAFTGGLIPRIATADGAADLEAVPRAAPRAARALDPQVAVKGAGPSLRHGHDGDASPDAKLRCRWPAQIVTAIQHVVTGDQVLRSLPTSGVPDEVLGLAR